jgi:hypothetical protein
MNAWLHFCVETIQNKEHSYESQIFKLHSIILVTGTPKHHINKVHFGNCFSTRELITSSKQIKGQYIITSQYRFSSYVSAFFIVYSFFC